MLREYIKAFVISVAPFGNSVLSIDQIKYNGSNELWAREVERIVDDMDESSPLKCFKMAQKNILGIHEVELHLSIGKHVSHIQVMVPNDKDSGKFKMMPLTLAKRERPESATHVRLKKR